MVIWSTTILDNLQMDRCKAGCANKGGEGSHFEMRLVLETKG